MKDNVRFFIFLALLLAVAWPGVAYAKDLHEDQVVFGGSYTLSSGETLDGNLFVFGGLVLTESGSLIDGDVILFGGSLDVNGEIRGDVIAMGGVIDVGTSGVIEGDVVLLGGHVDEAIGSDISGELINGLTGPLSLDFPAGVEIPRLGFRFSPIFDLLWFVFRLFLWAAVAILVVLLLPKHTERTASTASKQPLLSWALGLLTAVVLPFVVLLLSITIILIPGAILLVLLVAIAWAFGLIALGYEIGKRLNSMFSQEWAPALSAGLGTFILILVINGLDMAIPCLGWIFPALAGMIGLGALFLSRFGTQDYPPGDTFAKTAVEQNETSELTVGGQSEQVGVDQEIEEGQDVGNQSGS
jgi:hypothetical protein